MPKILLITPSPVDEYQLEPIGTIQDQGGPQRTAANTKRYAETCREVGRELNVPVVDLWSVFMKAAGWKEGLPLPGSKETESNDVLKTLLLQGKHIPGVMYSQFEGI